MLGVNNPFTPNFGQIPHCLVGRDLLIGEVLEALEAGSGHPALSSIIIGARGTGKTALLSLLGSEAGRYGWVTVNVVCSEGMLEDIYQQSMQAAAQLVDSDASRRLAAVNFAQIIGLEWDYEDSFQPNWRTRMSALLDKLSEKGVGLLITVDEVDPSLSEMVQLASVYQLFVREQRKVALLMAGLPSHVTQLLGDRTVSFLRRASQYHLERVTDHDVERAFKKTIEQAGGSIDDAALDAAVRAADGFPYMIQLVGFRSWQEAAGSSPITAENVEKGARAAVLDLRSRVLKATFDELSDGDLAFLEAMAGDEGGSLIADIQERLGKPSGHVSQYRRRLIDRGVITSAGRGRVAFDLPGAREYLPEYLERRWLGRRKRCLLEA